MACAVKNPRNSFGIQIPARLAGNHSVKWAAGLHGIFFNLEAELSLVNPTEISALAVIQNFYLKNQMRDYMTKFQPRVENFAMKSFQSRAETF